MTERVARLRRQSLDAVPVLSHERALLMTAFAKGSEHLSPPLRRAHAFRTLMEQQSVCINDGELIVGERGPAPKATSTYPELCCHSLEDLSVLNAREKIRYAVPEETAAVYRDGEDYPRSHLCRDDAGMDGGVRRRNLHRVHGAARPGAHRP